MGVLAKMATGASQYVNKMDKPYKEHLLFIPIIFLTTLLMIFAAVLSLLLTLVSISIHVSRFAVGEYN